MRRVTRVESTPHVVIDDEFSNTSIVPSGTTLHFIQRVSPVGYGGTGSRSEMSIDADALAEALGLLGWEIR